MSKTVIFVGYIRKSYLDYFVKKGYTIGLFYDKESGKLGESFIDDIHKYLDFVVPVNFQSGKSIATSLQDFYFSKESILLCVKDKYVLATSYIADTLKLKYSQNLSLDLARNLTNKIFQRKVFKENYPEITPNYKKIKTFHSAYLFTRKYGFPVMVKPVNLASSQLVNICYNLEDLIAKVSYVLDHVEEVYKQNQIHRTPQVSIEEFIPGSQYSVDTYITHSGEIFHTPICKQTIGIDLGYDNFQTLYSGYPSELSKKQEKIVLDTVTKAVKSLGIKGGIAHTEVKIDKDDNCKIVEVNLRAGAYRAAMLKQSYQINHPENIIKTIIGEKPEIPNKFYKYTACPQLWPEQEGSLIKVTGIEEARKLKSVKELSVSYKKGELIGPANLGFDKGVHGILAHEDKKQLEADVKKLRELIKFDLKLEPKAEDEE